MLDERGNAADRRQWLRFARGVARRVRAPRREQVDQRDSVAETSHRRFGAASSSAASSSGIFILAKGLTFGGAS